MTDNLQSRILTTYSLPEGNIRMPGCLHVQKYAEIFHLPVIIYQLQLLELWLELGLAKKWKKLKSTTGGKYWGKKRNVSLKHFFLKYQILNANVKLYLTFLFFQQYFFLVWRILQAKNWDRMVGYSWGHGKVGKGIKISQRQFYINNCQGSSLNYIISKSKKSKYFMCRHCQKCSNTFLIPVLSVRKNLLHFILNLSIFSSHPKTSAFGKCKICQYLTQSSRQWHKMVFDISVHYGKSVGIFIFLIITIEEN